MKLFPHLLIRISGGPFENIETLKVNKSAQIFKDIYSLKEKIDNLKSEISNELYHLIPLKKDNKLQNLLLNFKRDIFNERKISQERLELITPHFTKKITNNFHRYNKIKEEIQCLYNAGEETYNREITIVRETLRNLAKNETLQKGLLLSSQSLLEGIDHYLAKDSKSLGKNDFKTEQGLIKYISRLYAKTSPFSTFTNLAVKELGLDSAKKIQDKNVKIKPEVKSHILLNNFLYAYLKGLLTKNNDIYRWFLLRPNPSLIKKDEHYVFLTNNNNIEAFQRIPFNQVLEVFQILTSEKKEGLIYNELVRTIIENEYIDAPAEDIEAYINQLIEYGFLEFNIGVSGIDPNWDLKLCEKLKPLAKRLPLIKELILKLKMIRNYAHQYGISKFEDRKKILTKAYGAFKAICMKLHKVAGLPEDERKSPEELKESFNKKQKDKKLDDANDSDNKETEEKDEVFKHQTDTYFYFKPEQMFYEDTSLNISPELDEKGLYDLVSNIDNLLQEMKMFEWHFDETDKMLYYFIEKYGKEASVNLLNFYEDYYREFKKPEAEKQEKILKEKKEKNKKKNGDKDINGSEKDIQQNKQEFVEIPSIKERQRKNEEWLNQFISIINDEAGLTRETINLKFEQIKKVQKSSPVISNINNNACSYGAFLQFIIEKNKNGREELMAVLNSSFAGFGKMYSRFLHIFDDYITQDIRQWNKALSHDKLFVEDCDASFFNANLHPPLMPYEIWMPNGHNSLPEEKQIPVTELVVSVDKKNNQLQLTHANLKKRVYIFDLGFQGHMGRSQLFQLLEKFTIAEYLYCYPLTNRINNYLQSKNKEEKNKNEKQIWIRPRIIYENKIILQRKAWFIPKKLLPFQKPNQNDWSYFAMLNEWKEEHGMPEEVFIFILGYREIENIDEDTRKKISRDDYKPQYISFKNPFLVNLFKKLINKVPNMLRIEEMLPNSNQLLHIGANHYITEFVVQWYKSKGKVN